MSIGVPCYLVEWYRSAVAEERLDDTASRLSESAASMSAQGTPVQLLTMLAVPADEVLFGVFTACSAAAVAQMCDRAGIPAQRVTTATDLSGIPHAVVGERNLLAKVGDFELINRDPVE